jgi:hypothetical protein
MDGWAERGNGLPCGGDGRIAKCASQERTVMAVALGPERRRQSPRNGGRGRIRIFLIQPRRVFSRKRCLCCYDLDGPYGFTIVRNLRCR